MTDVVEFESNGRTHKLIKPAYDMWVKAGKPSLEEAGRTYQRQKFLYDGWKAGLPGFNRAHNPDDPELQLPHLRYAAIDLTNRRDVAKAKAAGWIFDAPDEWWHARLPDIWNYPIIKDQTTAGNIAPVSDTEKDEAMDFINIQGKAGKHEAGQFAIYRSNSTGVLYAKRLTKGTLNPMLPTFNNEALVELQKIMPFLDL